MLTFAQAVLLGLMQGIAELFPISSLGHTVLVPALLHWPIDEASDQFVAFLVATHLATALVLVGFFWRDWHLIIAGILRSLRMRQIKPDDTYAKIGWLLVIATIPAGILGLLFEEALQQAFANPYLVSIALLLNGALLMAAERLTPALNAPNGDADDTQLRALSWTQAVGIGCFQCLALVPGFSRTGLVMAGGLANRLSHENAARFAFLLATPIILAAAVLKLPDLFIHGTTDVGPAAIGALCAAITAYLSVRFLSQYFQRNNLMVFAIYCVIAGAASIVSLAVTSASVRF